jgi:dynein heavy chain
VYGGRVTDDIDRRLLKTILKNFIAEEVLEDNYTYYDSCYKPLGKSSLNQASILEEISLLPDFDQPEIFGMTEIADLNCSLQES